MKKKILIVVAHPDDELLGVGGTLIEHVEAGDCVHVMILAEGITSRSAQRDDLLHSPTVDNLHSISYNVSKFLGVEKLIMCNYPDNRMDSVDLLDIIKKIEQEIFSFKPDIVYTHHAGDINIDHVITHNAVVTACRNLPGSSVKTILFFETLSSTELQVLTCDKIFIPNWFVDISGSFEKKIEALHLYETEMRLFPHPRSYKAVEILASYRGCSVGIDKAEAFMLGRKLNKINQ